MATIPDGANSVIKKGTLADALVKIKLTYSLRETITHVSRTGELSLGCLEIAHVPRVSQPILLETGRGHLLAAAITQQDIARSGSVAGGMQFGGPSRLAVHPGGPGVCHHRITARIHHYIRPVNNGEGCPTSK
jgi:hypothetical protein